MKHSALLLLAMIFFSTQAEAGYGTCEKRWEKFRASLKGYPRPIPGIPDVKEAFLKKFLPKDSPSAAALERKYGDFYRIQELLGKKSMSVYGPSYPKRKPGKPLKLDPKHHSGWKVCTYALDKKEKDLEEDKE